MPPCFNNFFNDSISVAKAVIPRPEIAGKFSLLSSSTKISSTYVFSGESSANLVIWTLLTAGEKLELPDVD